MQSRDLNMYEEIFYERIINNKGFIFGYKPTKWSLWFYSLIALGLFIFSLYVPSAVIHLKTDSTVVNYYRNQLDSLSAQLEGLSDSEKTALVAEFFTANQIVNSITYRKGETYINLSRLPNTQENKGTLIPASVTNEPLYFHIATENMPSNSEAVYWHGALMVFLGISLLVVMCMAHYVSVVSLLTEQSAHSE